MGNILRELDTLLGNMSDEELDTWVFSPFLRQHEPGRVGAGDERRFAEDLARDPPDLLDVKILVEEHGEQDIEGLVRDVPDCAELTARVLRR